jgi:hypothetical protein
VRQVDDLEALMPQTDPPAHQLPAAVGTAPRLAAHHRGDRVRIRDGAVESYLSGYAAHARAASSKARLWIISLMGS